MKSVIINSDKSIGYLEDYKGHTLQNVREWDPGTTEKPEGVYVLEFSDETAQDQLLTIEEQKMFFNVVKEVKTGSPIESSGEAVNMVAKRIFENAIKELDE